MIVVSHTAPTAQQRRPAHARWLLVAALCSAAPMFVRAQSPAVLRVAERLEPEITRAMAEGRIPSLTIALVSRDEILYSRAFGASNVWAKTPATVETIYLIGSTFKAQSTIALLQQMEAGKFALDDPVHNYLPSHMKIRGENAAQPVTFRHLLTHTSGMPAAFGGHPVWGETVPPALEAYLTDSLQVQTPPLQRVVYSNLAYSLVAFLVERFSGVPYQTYIRDRIWKPLDMTSTAFMPTPHMEERLSVPYITDNAGAFVATTRVKANVWPAGIVYGTVLDQARWVMFNLGDGALPSGPRLLRAETMRAMQSLQYPQLAGTPLGGGWGYEKPGYGLTWWTTTRNDEHFFGHSGSVSGYTAFVMGNTNRGFGIALLTNGNRAHAHLVRISNLALDLLAQEVGSSRD